MPFTFKLSKRLALMKARVLVVAAAAAVGCDVDRSLSGPSAPRFATSTTTQAAPPDSISVESTYGGYSASVIHDGVIDPAGGTGTTWASADEGPTTPHWITVSFARPTTISSAAIDWAYNGAQGRFMTAQDVDVKYWDGAPSQPAASLLYSGADVANSSVTFPSVTTTTLRFYQPANMGPPAYPAILWLTEIEYRGAGISVESTYGGYSTSVIHDGVINAAGGTATTWASADEGPTAAHWITVSFASPTTISSAAIDWAYNGAQGRFMTSQDVDVQYWDGTAYQTAASLLYSGADVANSSVTFPSVTTTTLRFYQPANMGPPAYPAILWLTEIEYRGAGISVESTYGGYSTSVIHDGVINAAGGTATTWASADEGPTAAHWITVSFASPTTISSAAIDWAYNGAQGRFMTSQDVDVQYWDGTAYQTAASLLYSGADVANSSVTFPSVTTTTLRFYQPANMGPPAYPAILWLTEIEYRGAGISVESTYGGYSTSVIHDGVINAAGGTATTWASADEGPTAAHWITVSFASPTTISSAAIDWAYNGAQGRFMTSQDVDVQYWDGTAYQTAASLLYSGADVANSSVTFPSVTTTTLRFYQPANMGPPAYPAILWLTEIEYRGAGISVESTYGGYSTSVIHDGVINAAGGTATTWASADEGPTAAHWITVSFATPTTISSAAIDWAYNTAQGRFMTSQDVDVQYWDGTAYQTAASLLYSGGDVANSSVTFPSVPTTALRFYQPANMGPPAYPAILWLTEIEYGES